MALILNIEKFPLILKECFLFYSFKIDNCIYTNLGEKTYKFNYTENTSLYNFAKFLKDKNPQYLTIDWLFDYFNYQFTYWSFVRESKIKEDPKYLINLHWILGQKALKRYLARSKKDTYYYNSVFYPKYEIKKNDLINILNLKDFIREIEEETYLEEDKVIQVNPLNKEEELNKEKKLNTIEGFYFCLNYTTLFKYNSNVCLRCTYKVTCKNLLKKRFPILYQKRFANKMMLQRKKEEDGNETEERSQLSREGIRRSKRKFKFTRK
jgi:hypothetical protein